MFALFKLLVLFGLVYATTLLAISQMMTLPDEPLLRYVVLALPVFAALTVIVTWHGMWRRQHESTQHATTPAPRRNQSV